MAAILAARDKLGVGPHRLASVVGSPRSTISDVLRRHGLSRLRDRDRASGVPIRYVREHPGELLHVDVKKLGWVPEGGGHRVRIERVMTDNALNCTRSADFGAALAELGPAQADPRLSTPDER